MTQPDWSAWEALGWTPNDIALLRAHAGAMGIAVTIPTAPPRPQRHTWASVPTPTPTTPSQPRKEPPVPYRSTLHPTPPAKVSKHKQNYITHVALVLDASGSMGHLADQVIKVADAQIAHLAQRSRELDQETRVTVYIFDDEVECVIYDKDVLRLPSLLNLYKIGGTTALIDATALALNDLAMTPEKYGDHAFVVFVLTDGGNNVNNWKAPELKEQISQLADHWTVAALVPNMQGKFEAKQFGFPADNIAVWDASSKRGLEEAVEKIKVATDVIMSGRASGVRGSKNLFVIDSSVVNAQSIAAAKLKPVPYDDYTLVPIPPLRGLVKPDDWDTKHPRTPWKAHGGRIDDFVQNVNNSHYQAGQAFYQLVEGKTERIQADKHIVIMDKDTRRVYFGPAVRKMLGLADDREVRVKPTASDKHLVYVQSKAPNRQLVVGSHLLIFNKPPRSTDYQ
jgi:hypothetical protein